MIQSDANQPRGVLYLKTGEQRYQLSLHQSPPDLDFFITHYWIISWNLEEPYYSETLPHPSVHLVIEQGRSEIVGVVTGKFTRRIEGKGRVFGIKFRPGAFYPFVRTPVSEFTDRTSSVQGVFGPAGAALETAILAVEDKHEMVDIADTFIRERLPERDANVALIHEITNYIVSNREVTKVDDVVSHFTLTKRTLQRLFSQYVGIGPKWMIKRYRLHEVAAQLQNGEPVNWPKLALDLGYFDQAHFIKDFKNLVGWTPGEYTRRISLDTSS